jgi:hypothetical protein
MRRIGIAMLFFSVCLFLLADVEAYGQWRLNRTGVIAIGEVMSFSGKSGKYPIVRFQAPDGETYTFKEKRFSVFSPVHQGEHLEVIFPQERPHEACVVRTRWVGVWILAGFAFFMGCFGLAFLPLFGRRPASQS